MSFHNNEFVRAEAEHLAAPDESESNFLAIPESPGVSENFGVSAKDFDLKICFNNTSDHVPKQPGNTVSNTSIEFLYRKDSEEEFTTWPKRRIKLQGGRLVCDKERASDVMDITPECHVHPEIPNTASDNTKPLETQHEHTTEHTQMEFAFTGPFCDISEEFSSNCGSLFENNIIASTTKMEHTAGIQGLKSNSEPYAGIKKHILDLPDLVLEHILGYVDLNDLCMKVRPVCRTFYTLSSRILRLAFKSIHTRLNSILQKLENQHPGNWNPICAEVLTCKLLQSEMNTLRAACSRQIESGQFYFIHGDVLQEYQNILQAVQDGKINAMLDGFSDTLIKLNEKPLKYWDTRYDDEDMPLADMKLLGVEIIEILLSALNASGCVVVTYQPSYNSASSSDDTQGEEASGSCMMAGCVSIKRSTELKPPPIEHISVKPQRRAILRYIRSLVRANNCDIVLYKLRAYSKEKEATPPVFEHRAWSLCNSKMLHHSMVQESYKKEPIADHTGSPVPDCNMHVLCNFEMVCPKRINPFGIALNRCHESSLSSQVLISEEKDAHAKHLSESLSGDHYIFKMDFKTWASGNSQENSIEIEHNVTKANKWFLNINSSSSSADQST